MIDMLRKLCALSGVSGNEEEVRSCIIDLVGGYADDITTDVMGSVIVFKKGAKTIS